MLRGDEPPDSEYGWEAIHAIERDLHRGVQKHLKLLRAQPEVDKLLERVSVKQCLEVHTDLETAIAPC